METNKSTFGEVAKGAFFWVPCLNKWLIKTSGRSGSLYWSRYTFHSSEIVYVLA